MMRHTRAPRSVHMPAAAWSLFAARALALQRWRSAASASSDGADVTGWPARVATEESRRRPLDSACLSSDIFTRRRHGPSNTIPGASDARNMSNRAYVGPRGCSTVATTYWWPIRSGPVSDGFSYESSCVTGRERVEAAAARTRAANSERVRKVTFQAYLVYLVPPQISWRLLV